MKNYICILPLALLVGCASTPQKDPLTSSSVASALRQFKLNDGPLKTPVSGKFKQASATKTHSRSSHGFDCSGTDTIKEMKYLNINANPDGSVLAKEVEDDCGKVYNYTYKGLQTQSNLYLYRANSPYIEHYKIDETTGALKNQASYYYKNGSLTSSPATQNNQTWSHGLGNNYSYKTTYYQPEKSWAEVDKFERSITVKKGGPAAGSFNWGKALALGVGSVAGGGLKLDSAAQGSVLSGIVLDSMGDTEGVSNFEQAVKNAIPPSLEVSSSVRAAGSGAVDNEDLPSKLETDLENNDPTFTKPLTNTNNTSPNTDFKPLKFCGRDATQGSKFAEFQAATKHVLDTEKKGGTYKERLAVQYELDRLSAEYYAWEQAYKLEQCGPSKAGSSGVTIE